MSLARTRNRQEPLSAGRYAWGIRPEKKTAGRGQGVVKLFFPELREEDGAGEHDHEPAEDHANEVQVRREARGFPRHVARRPAARKVGRQHDRAFRARAAGDGAADRRVGARPQRLLEDSSAAQGLSKLVEGRIDGLFAKLVDLVGEVEAERRLSVIQHMRTEGTLDG